jgi:hypothetical protein
LPPQGGLHPGCPAGEIGTSDVPKSRPARLSTSPRVRANGAFPAIRGKNLYDLKDQDGKFTTQEFTYNWQKTSGDRYRRVQRFVDAFFPKIAEFQKPPRHPKWREVNIAATLPGWTRFEVAQTWLESQHAQRASAEPAARPPSTQPASPSNQPALDPALYQEFMRWRQQQGR